MTILYGAKGAWVNQYALPTADAFRKRAAQVDYVIIKASRGPYFGEFYVGLCTSMGKPWLAEVMGEDYAGDQAGYTRAQKYANELADFASQQGCAGMVINLEEADGGWHKDTGAGANLLISQLRIMKPDLPIFASLDTRGGRANYPYQLVCAAQCDGVMPMMYPDAFGLSVEKAYTSVLTSSMLDAWRGKEIIPTIQTYGSISPYSVEMEGNLSNLLHQAQRIHGVNAYTLGHANDSQWNAFLDSCDWTTGIAPTPMELAIAEALRVLAAAWKAQWTAIAERGTIEEASQLLMYWKLLVSK